QKNSYTVEKKCKAVELALCTSNSHAVQLYSLDLTIVGCWVKALFQVPSPSHSQKNTRSIGSGYCAFFPEEEAQLYE
ncbi:2927_t:CDS:1, partial [Gigaspora margarita]